MKKKLTGREKSYLRNLLEKFATKIVTEQEDYQEELDKISEKAASWSGFKHAKVVIEADGCYSVEKIDSDGFGIEVEDLRDRKPYEDAVDFFNQLVGEEGLDVITSDKVRGLFRKYPSLKEDEDVKDFIEFYQLY